MVQSVDDGAEHHHRRNREYRDAAARGRTLGEFRVHWQVVVEARVAAEIIRGGIGEIGIVGEVGAGGIVRIAFVGHDWVPPFRETTSWRGGRFLTRDNFCRWI